MHLFVGKHNLTTLSRWNVRRALSILPPGRVSCLPFQHICQHGQGTAPAALRLPGLTAATAGAPLRDGELPPMFFRVGGSVASSSKHPSRPSGMKKGRPSRAVLVVFVTVRQPYRLAATLRSRRASWLVKPDSLSYQMMSLAMVPSMTWVDRASTTPPWVLPLKSMETRGSSQ